MSGVFGLVGIVMCCMGAWLFLVGTSSQSYSRPGRREEGMEMLMRVIFIGLGLGTAWLGWTLTMAVVG